MKRKVGISLYLFLAVVIGFLCYWAFYFFLFLLYGFQFSLKFISIDIPPDIPSAILIGIIMVAGVGIYLYLGKRFIKNGRIIALALVIVLATACLNPYVIDLKGEIRENNAHKKFVITHEGEMVNQFINQVNQALIKSNLPFTLDLKTSLRDTSYYRRYFRDSYLRLFFKKIGEEELSEEEVGQLLGILPEKQRDYRINIKYKEGSKFIYFHNCLYAQDFLAKESGNESEVVNQFNEVLTKSNLPFAINLKASHDNTLDHNDKLWVQVEKTNEENLTLEEIEQLVKMLPEQQNSYWIEILYGKSIYEKQTSHLFNDVFRSKEKSITIFLDENKKVTECSGQDQELCEAIELLVGCSS